MTVRLTMMALIADRILEGNRIGQTALETIVHREETTLLDHRRHLPATLFIKLPHLARTYHQTKCNKLAIAS